jgi:hypothetical protein
MSAVWQAKSVCIGQWATSQGLLVQAYSNSNSTLDANSADPHWQGVYLSDMCNGTVAIKTFADY